MVTVVTFIITPYMSRSYSVTTMRNHLKNILVTVVTVIFLINICLIKN